MANPPDRYAATALVQYPLHGANADDMCRTYLQLSLAYRRLLKVEGDDEPVLLVLDSDSIDPAGLLVFFYVLRQFHSQRNNPLWYSSWGETREYIRENLEHYMSGAHDGGAGGDFLLRDLTSPDEMVSDLHEYAQHLSSNSNASPQQVAVWETQVGELATNGFQHAYPTTAGVAQRSRAVVAGKAYPAEGRVQMGVMDFGVGIPATIGTIAGPELVNKGDGVLISHAMNRRVTSKTVADNQGAGLPGIVDAVKEAGGSLTVVSGEGVCAVHRRKSPRRLIKKEQAGAGFAGTLAIIDLPI